MADAKISDLATKSIPVAADLLLIVDVDDTSMASTGTDKKTTVADLLANAGGIASWTSSTNTIALGVAGSALHIATPGTDLVLSMGAYDLHVGGQGATIESTLAAYVDLDFLVVDGWQGVCRFVYPGYATGAGNVGGEYQMMDNGGAGNHRIFQAGVGTFLIAPNGQDGLVTNFAVGTAHPAGRAHFVANAANQTVLVTEGFDGTQSGPHHTCVGVSSNGSRRDLAYLDAGFSLATDAGYLGYLSLRVQDFGDNSGLHPDGWEGIRIASNGTGAVLTLTTTTFTGTATLPARIAPTTVDADAATVTFDLAASDWHRVTLGGNRTLALANPAVDQQFTVVLKQDGTGSRTVTWFAGIVWFTPDGNHPEIAPGANKRTVLTFKCEAAGVYLGFVAGIQV